MHTDAPLHFAAALSNRSSWTGAVDEACRQALERLDGQPDLAFLFISSLYSDLDDGIAERASRLLGSCHLIGCTGESIIGAGREIEGEPTVAVWLARLDGIRIRSMALELENSTETSDIVGWPEELETDWPEQATLLIVGEPFTFPADLMVERLVEAQPGTQVMGGMASGGDSPGENRLFLNDATLATGAVAVMLDGPIGITPIVSQGCRPIGQHFVVTRSEGNVIQELGGKPSLLQLKSVFDTLSTSEQRLTQHGLHLGRVVDEYQDRFGQGDFLVRNVLGVDPDTGAIAVSDFIRPGHTVQFHVRDEKTADDEMRQLCSAVRDHVAGAPLGALVFTCNGRGQRLFSDPDHDIGLVREYFGEIPAAGFFAAGEIGPVGGKSFLHGFTASIVLFHATGDIPTER